MKKNAFRIITLLVILILAYCAVKRDHAQTGSSSTNDIQANTENLQTYTEDSQASTEDAQTSARAEKTENTGKGEEPMIGSNYMTKEEFIEFVSTKNINVNMTDFAGIDIDDFIHDQLMVKDLLDVEDVSGFDFQASIERYIQKLEYKKLEPHMAKEVISVICSDEEYKSFTGEYFKKIDAPYKLLFTDKYELDNYVVSLGGENYRILIGRTENLEKCQLTRDNNGNYCVVYIDDPSLSIPIFYSRNLQCFILANMYDEAEYGLIKTFCEIDE
jgi:hypothetical protein